MDFVRPPNGGVFFEGTLVLKAPPTKDTRIGGKGGLPRSAFVRLAQAMDDDAAAQAVKHVRHGKLQVHIPFLATELSHAL